MKMLFGVVLGALATWLYSSEQARKQVREGFSDAPASLQQLQHTAASAAASGAQRVAEAIDSAPLPERVKGAASEATFNVWAAADSVGEPASDAARQPGADAKSQA